MCGIYCNLVHNKNKFLNDIAKEGEFKVSNVNYAKYCQSLKNRGPDCYNELNIDISQNTILQLAGSVLWTQGSFPVSQPFHEEGGNVLLWNGDIFSGPLEGDGNDTKALWVKLQTASNEELSIPEIFASIKGPYSFIFFQQSTKKLYFGRDVIGRHSLLIGFSERSITITSVCSRQVQGYSEVPAVGVFAFDLEKDGDTPVTLYPWSHLSESTFQLQHLLPNAVSNNFQVGKAIKSWLQAPRRNSKVPPPSDLELWTVQSTDSSIGNLLNRLNFAPAKTRAKQTMDALLKKQSIQIMVEDLINTLKQSLKIRLEKQPQLCKDCVRSSVEAPDSRIKCSHSKLAILFSGGLDSAVLAGLAHQFMPLDEQIDLLNVSFEKIQKQPDLKRSKRTEIKSPEPDCPYNGSDRITGLSTLNELKTIYPERKWNFVEINITQEELKKKRKEVITNLIYPLNTILDESLGCALWFASRGRGTLNGTTEMYTSPARIILSGIGADEQLGGYMRHRITLKSKGWEALDAELQYELKRISYRNLGRDDRVVGDHGRQLRMPYLDEDVINYLCFLPPWNRCNPVDSMSPGLGDKLLLRLAAWELGFREAATLPKKAMQFGSRIANSREKASEVSKRL